MKALKLAGIAVLALAATVPAHAGNVSTLEVLGFSADGDIFAFEEYGIQDGSGFAYANRFYIDTGNDTFVSGSPVRVTIEEDGAGLEAARAETRQQGEKIVADAELAENAGHAAGRNAITEHSADFSRMRVNPRPVFPPVDAPLEFRIEDVRLDQPERCKHLGEVMGFRLVRVASEPGEETRVVHEDSSVPASRGCPLDYRIGGIQTFFPRGGEPVYAVLLAVESFGFEGPNFDWMAVTGRL